MTTPIELGVQFAQLRLSKGLSPQELAKLVGVRAERIQRLEAGAEDGKLSFLRQVAAALGSDITFEIVKRARRYE